MEIQFILGTLFLALFVFLMVFTIFKVKHEYNDKKKLSNTSVVLVWLTYCIHAVIVFFSALKSIWEFPTGFSAYIIGGILIILGVLFCAVALINFRSFQRMSGIDTSKLIDFGIYRYSRNPQNVGWVLFLLGIAILGKSLFSILFVLIFILLFSLYLPIEEKYLDSIFGESYREYCKKTPRYFGLPKNNR